jgi:hypothetical protein
MSACWSRRCSGASDMGAAARTQRRGALFQCRHALAIVAGDRNLWLTAAEASA